MFSDCLPGSSARDNLIVQAGDSKELQYVKHALRLCMKDGMNLSDAVFILDAYKQSEVRLYDLSFFFHSFDLCVRIDLIPWIEQLSFVGHLSEIGHTS